MFMKKMKNKNNKKIIFMDYASGTPISKEVYNDMLTYFSNKFYNPSSIYQEGFNINAVLHNSRSKIAEALFARPQEIIFTDGGTEANNLALRGLISKWREKNKNKIPHIITSQIEHASILETCKDLEKQGLAKISYISVNKEGIINLKELKKSLKENTILVSIAYVNGEIGIIQDIKSLAKKIRHYRKHHKTKLPYFHTDAVQGLNYLDLNVQKLGIDFMTINGSKIYGPKKIAALYKKSNIDINPIITGGSQEFGIRAGTENVPYIVGFAKAVEIAGLLRKSECDRLNKLQIYTEKILKEKMTIDFEINALGGERVPHIINISIPNLSSEEIVLRLDAVGIKASVKSACKSGEYGDSHVIKALRNKNTQSIRFSFGRNTTKKDIDYAVYKLVDITNKMKKTGDMYIKK